MFTSKVYTPLTNYVSKVFCENLIPHRLTSTAVDAVEQFTETPPVPDKLYKKIEVEVRGNDRSVLGSYGRFVTMTANHLNITIGRNVTPEKAIHERLTVLKSVHIYKKHRVQYETRTYFRYIDFLRLTGSTADTLLEYLQRNLPEGVAMKVTKIEIQRLPSAVNPPTV